MACLLLLALLVGTSSRGRAAGKHDEVAPPTVAVLYFDYSGKDEQMAVLRKGLAQILTSDLSSIDAVRVVERAQLEAVLAELKLNRRRAIDQSSANKIGKLLGAHYLVLGAYFDLLGTLRADARIVEVETGRVIQSAGASGKPNDFLSVEQKIGADLAVALRTLKPRSAQGSGKGPPPPAKRAPVPPPAQLKIPTALRYARALDALDRGERDTARSELQTVVKEQPDFKLAALDLDRMIQ